MSNKYTSFCFDYAHTKCTHFPVNVNIYYSNSEYSLKRVKRTRQPRERQAWLPIHECIYYVGKMWPRRLYICQSLCVSARVCLRVFVRAAYKTERYKGVLFTTEERNSDNIA